MLKAIKIITFLNLILSLKNIFKKKLYLFLKY